MLGDAVDVDVAFFGIEVPDRDQGRVFDTSQADARAMAAAHGFVPREESEQAVDQPAEVTVGAVDQHFGPRNRQRCFFVRVT